MKGKTVYSELIAGTKTNHHFSCRFDWTDGIVGISQFDKVTNHWTDRVLLSKAQVAKLLAFLSTQKGKK